MSEKELEEETKAELKGESMEEIGSPAESVVSLVSVDLAVPSMAPSLASLLPRPRAELAASPYVRPFQADAASGLCFFDPWLNKVRSSPESTLRDLQETAS